MTDPAAAQDLSPAMRQFHAVKQRHPDCIVFFRIGDFYELFYDDAKTASRVLGLTLTARSKGDNAVPMAGVPFHAVESYLARMLEAGFRVAVVEQLEDPKAAKGVIKRDVVRLITPGTLTDETLLKDNKPNFLAALCRDRSRAGLAWVELSTGQFFTQDLDEKELGDELARIQPAECLVPESEHTPASKSDDQAEPPFLITPRPDWVFHPDTAVRALCTQFQTHTLEGFGFAKPTVGLRAAGAIVEYLNETQKTRTSHIRSVKSVAREGSVVIDPVTLNSLEVARTLRSGEAAGSLLNAVDRTRTSMGGRLLRQWVLFPLAQAEPIRLRQQAIAELVDNPQLLHELRERLGSISDIERIVGRLSCGRASPRDLLGLGRSLAALAPIAARLSDPLSPLLADLASRLVSAAGTGIPVRPSIGGTDIPVCPPSIGGTDIPVCPPSNRPDSPITGRQSPAGDAFREGEALAEPQTQGSTKWPVDPTTASTPSVADPSLLHSSQDRPSDTGHWPLATGHSPTPTSDLAARIATAIRDDAPNTLRDGGIIKDGFDPELDRLRDIARNGQRWIAEFQASEVVRTGIPSLKVGFNQVFGYYIEITNTHRDKAPSDYIRKQTVKNAERYITETLKQHESEVLTAEERTKLLEADLFERLRREIALAIPAIQQSAAAIAELDALAGFAHLAQERRYVRPQIVEEPVLEILDGRHPVLDQTLESKFVPNDVRLDERECRLALITGPNMAGKSTYIRQTALLVLLAHTGSFLPASRAVVGLCDRIFARVGASDELSRGRSTFMVEMTETANILHNATKHSVVILDEIGRGTSTYDGLSLAWSIAEHISENIGCRTLFATHYHELVELAAVLKGTGNFNVAVREWQDEIVFLHRIVPGGADKSYGLHVARLAGLPAQVVARAREVLHDLETGSRTSDAGIPGGRGSRRAAVPDSTDPQLEANPSPLAPDPRPHSSDPRPHSSDPGPQSPRRAGPSHAAKPAAAVVRRILNRRDREQLLLFEDLPHPILHRLRTLDPSALTPDAALALLRALALDAAASV